MTQARLIYKKISTSEDVNRLPLPARLLFTWMILEGDHDGRLKGEPSFIKVSVVPYTNWSSKLIESYLNEMKDIGLIWYWQQNGQRYIEFPKWLEYQHIRRDRYVPSVLPSYAKYIGNHVTTKVQPDDNQMTPQENITEVKTSEVKKSEDKESFAVNNVTAEKPKNTNTSFQIVNPRTFVPRNAEEAAAKDAWMKLEPLNPYAFITTYLDAARKGLPADMFYRFVSEIQQSKAIKPGAVFQTKAKAYFETKK